MNSFTKLNDGSWGVRVFPGVANPGDVVVVQTRAGARKSVTIGELVASDQYGRVYRTAPTPRRDAEVVGDLSRIVAMFARASGRLRTPAITLDGFRVNVAGPRAREPGSLTITGTERTEVSRFGAGMVRPYFGRVTRAGMYEPSRGAPDGLGEKLRAFAADPAGQAAAFGHLHGRCCFCNHRLGEGEDRRSVEVGYGPDCADNFGLPWGARAAAAAAEQRLACDEVPAPVARSTAWGTAQSRARARIREEQAMSRDEQQAEFASATDGSELVGDAEDRACGHR